MRKDKALFIISVWLMNCGLFGIAEMLGGIPVQNGGRQYVTLDSKACCLRIFSILLLYSFTQHTKILFNSKRSKSGSSKYFKESHKKQRDSYLIKGRTLFTGGKIVRKYYEA